MTLEPHPRALGGTSCTALALQTALCGTRGRAARPGFRSSERGYPEGNLPLAPARGWGRPSPGQKSGQETGAAHRKEPLVRPIRPLEIRPRGRGGLQAGSGQVLPWSLSGHDPSSISEALQGRPPNPKLPLLLGCAPSRPRHSLLPEVSSSSFQPKSSVTDRPRTRRRHPAPSRDVPQLQLPSCSEVRPCRQRLLDYISRHAKKVAVNRIKNRGIRH